MNVYNYIFFAAGSLTESNNRFIEVLAKKAISEWRETSFVESIHPRPSEIGLSVRRMRRS